MAVKEIQPPAHVVVCDRCGNQHRPASSFADRVGGNSARSDAMAAGWDTRPFRGPGSRSAPDLCPTCSAGATGGDNDE